MSQHRSPKVWNKRGPDCPRDAVYVGRPSQWGNPWTIYRDGTREEVIEMFRRALPELLANRREDGSLVLDIKKLRGKDLACWCAPLPCHADILLEVANGPEI